VTMRARTSGTVDQLAALGADRGAAKARIERLIRLRTEALLPAGAEGWLEHAKRALATSEFHTAAYAARQARHQSGETAQVWSVLARAHAGMERFEDAVVEAQRAVRLAPQEAEPHLTLAGILVDLGNWDAALQCYKAAAAMANGSDAARIGTASVLLLTGEMHRARRILEDVYARGADEPGRPNPAGDYLALALTEVAEQVPVVRDNDTYFITSEAEIARMRELLDRAASVTRDPDVHAGVARVRRYVEACARHEFVASRLPHWCPHWVCATVAVLLLIGIVWLAVILGWLIPVAVIGPLTGAAVAYGARRYAQVPRWRLNKWAHDRETSG